MFKKEKKDKKIFVPNIHTKIIVENIEDYFNYIEELKNEDINYIHFISAENIRNFISNPAKKSILKNKEILNLKSKEYFKEILLDCAVKNLPQEKLKLADIYISFLIHNVYKIIKAKYANTDNIRISEIVDILENITKSIEEYNSFSSHKIEKEVIWHLNCLSNELNFNEVLNKINHNYGSINHNDKDLEEIKKLHIYETDTSYNKIITRGLFNKRINNNYNKNVIDINRKKPEIKKIIFDYIPEELTESYLCFAQLRAMGYHIIFPYIENQKISRYLKENSVDYKL